MASWQKATPSLTSSKPTVKINSKTSLQGKKKKEDRYKDFDADLIKTAKRYIAADVRLFSACQDAQEAAGIANTQKLISFVSPNMEGGAGTSLILQILYHRHKLKREIRESYEQHIADMLKQEEERKRKKKEIR